MSVKRLAIMGSTGSIGRQTLEAVSRHRGRFEVVCLAAGANAKALAQQAREWGVGALGLASEPAAAELQAALPEARVAGGVAGVCDLIAELRPDLLVAAASGVAGLTGVLAALSSGIDVALANKEPLVAAGHLVTQAAARSGARILPIDSEISAVFQCLEGRPRGHLARVLLTASGGPFRDWPPERLRDVTPAMALNHPTWRMGPKITVDCATLANKGFEVFELRWMFGLQFSQIRVLLHPQSIVHSLVELVDGSVLAQLGPPDMRFAIQYALTWPDRLPNDFPRLDLASVKRLSFEAPDLERFPCLHLAYEAGEAGLSYPAVLNGANERAVELFLAGRIGFTDIPRLVARALEAHEPVSVDTLAGVLAADQWAREQVSHLAAL